MSGDLDDVWEARVGQPRHVCHLRLASCLGARFLTAQALQDLLGEGPPALPVLQASAQARCLRATRSSIRGFHLRARQRKRNLWRSPYLLDQKAVSYAWYLQPPRNGWNQFVYATLKMAKSSIITKSSEVNAGSCEDLWTPPTCWRWIFHPSHFTRRIQRPCFKHLKQMEPGRDRSKQTTAKSF